MRHKALLFFTFCSLMLMFSCTHWRETAGEIAGMWQMTEWRNAERRVTQDLGIYYCIQLDLIKFQRKDKDDYYISYYTHARDSLVLGKIVHWPTDTVCTCNDLALKFYGVPADGRFHIDVLNDDHLQLSSEEATLVFRRY